LKLIPLDEMTPDLWYDAWTTMYDPGLADHMGVDPNLVRVPPTLKEFYQNIMDAHRAGRFMGWAITAGGVFKGHAILDKQLGEWEIGTVLVDPADWNSGLGARATLRACQWAFEEDGAEWVIAFTQGRDPKVPELLHRAGFRPFMHFHVASKDTWDARWRARRDRP
jgi:RimJ/RimL family protein N-acetyltransferase